MAQKHRDRSRRKLMAKSADEILPKTVKVVEKMAARGMTIDQIADLLSMARTKLQDLFLRHPELSIVYKRSKATTDSFVTGKLMEKIRAGNTACIIFYLKTQCGWHERIDFGGKVTHDMTESFAKAVATAPPEVRSVIDKMDDAARKQLLKRYQAPLTEHLN